MSGLRAAALGLVLISLGACRSDDDGFFSAFSAPSADNNPPTIAGTPKTTALAGQTYVFQPRATDPDGNALTFSIRNKPRWASFSSSTGRLYGRPALADTGVVSGVEISVSDGSTNSTVGPFDIQVDAIPVASDTPVPLPDPMPGPESGDRFMDLLVAAPEGTWVKINRNRFEEVWTPRDQRAELDGMPLGEPRKIISAWGAMAWDSNRAQLIIWGGGHADYAGNDVYRFDARTLRWERASLPSRVVQPLDDQQYFAADGAMNAPIGAHPYDNQEFLPLLDRFVTFGGAKYNAGQVFVLDDGVTKTGPYFWDPTKANPHKVGGTSGSQVHPTLFPKVVGGNMWQNRDSVVRNGTGSLRPDWFVNGTSAYAAENGRDVLYLSESPRTGGDLFKYVPGPLDAPTLDSWELIGIGNKSYADQGAGAVDPQRGLYLRTARFGDAYGIVMWSLEAPGPGNVAVTFVPRDSGGEFVMSNLHGMDFDAARQAFVLWDGGFDVWYLRPPVTGSPLVTGNWTVTRAPIAAGGPAPSLSESTGVLGKWKYAREYDVMIGLVDSVEGQVWAYKPVGWQPRH